MNQLPNKYGIQQTKITKTLGEFQNFLDNDNKTGLCLEDTLRFFDIQRIFGRFECIKQRGIKVTLIMTSSLKFYFYHGATDMRKSFDGLSGLIHGRLGRDPASGEVFIFINRRRDRVKLLRWEHTT